MIKRIKFYLVGILISLVFFTVGLLTLSDYGINIDEPIHFERGNAYLSYFITGSRKYLDTEFTGLRVSEWKYRGYDATYFIENDSGHPPLNGIIAAATNRVFYEKLGIIGDLQGYHLFEVFVSSILVFLVFAMVRSHYDVFAGTIASLSMALYPLFYGESRYNIKDPVEASFFAFTLYFLYLGIEKVRARYFFISSIFCALAFSTKFNIVFFPLIIIPYFIVLHGSPFIHQKNKLEILKKIPRGIYVSLLLYPVIVLGVHFVSRPFLWQDPINRFLYILQYYKDIGTGTNYQYLFLRHGWNTYATIFVAYSTPIFILIFSSLGALVSLSKLRNKRENLSILLLLWFGVTLLRVSLPTTSIYGGVRQIMEYIPAMAGLSGIGAFYLRNFLAKYINIKLASLIILASFIPLIMTLIKLHPNENLFMNFLVGGLKGATEEKIPGVGETMGNAYLQGILWLNQHAEKNARFGFPEGLGSNFPPQFVRKDIKFGGVFSGMAKRGEYMMEMYSVEYPFPRYHVDYLEKFIDPVHIITVDGVPILKIWKNDAAHTKKDSLIETEEKALFLVNKDGNEIEIDLDNPAKLSRLIIDHDDKNCISEGSGIISYSLDDKKEFRTPDDLYKAQGRYADSLQTKTSFIYFFTGQTAKIIKIIPEDKNLCLLKTKSVRVFGFKP